MYEGDLALEHLEHTLENDLIIGDRNYHFMPGSNSAYGGKSGIFIQMSFPRRPACGTPIGGNLHKKAIL
jgi:hypothetical protein